MWYLQDDSRELSHMQLRKRLSTLKKYYFIIFKKRHFTPYENNHESFLSRIFFVLVSEQTHKTVFNQWHFHPRITHSVC